VENQTCLKSSSYKLAKPQTVVSENANQYPTRIAGNTVCSYVITVSNAMGPNQLYVRHRLMRVYWIVNSLGVYLKRTSLSLRKMQLKALNTFKQRHITMQMLGPYNSQKMWQSGSLSFVKLSLKHPSLYCWAWNAMQNVRMITLTMLYVRM
jgi:hypothetical protein